LLVALEKSKFFLKNARRARRLKIAKHSYRDPSFSKEKIKNKKNKEVKKRKEVKI